MIRTIIDDCFRADEPVFPGNDGIPLGNDRVPPGNETVLIGNEHVSFGNEPVLFGNEHVPLKIQPVPFGNDPIVLRNEHTLFLNELDEHTVQLNGSEIHPDAGLIEMVGKFVLMDEQRKE